MIPNPPQTSLHDPDTKVVKKRRVSESGASVPSATVSTAQEPETPEAAASADTFRDGPNGNGRNGNGKGKPRKSNTPFQRVKPDTVQFLDERLRDNRFEARGGVEDDYGHRAARDLIVTRGAGFRKEKNKKKRGSYRGGEISMQVHSIKFTDD